MQTGLALVVGERLARYGFPDGHPFGPDRHAAFLREFEAAGLESRVLLLSPREASYEELLSFHTSRHIDFVRGQSVTGQGTLGGDTPAYRGVYEAAAAVVGGALVACEAIMDGRARHGFVPIAGLHHAGRDHAAGFCVFNDCGVVIEQLRRRHGLTRIGYVDIDAHHGDGVFYAYEDDPGVVFADIHESGESLYPGTGDEHERGRGEALGTKLNISLPAGSGDQAFEAAWPRVLEHLERHQPQFILFQCGADSIGGDPLTHLSLTPAAHGRAARDLKLLADRLGHGRVLGLGGGGYNRANLARAWTCVVAALV